MNNINNQFIYLIHFNFFKYLIYQTCCWIYWAGNTTIFPTFELVERTACPDANWLKADAGIATAFLDWLPTVAVAGINNLWPLPVNVALGATVLNDWLLVFNGTTCFV